MPIYSNLIQEALGRLYTASGSASGAIAGSEVTGGALQSYTGQDQYAIVYDLLCEGEIEGLVDGAASIYLNATPLMDADGNRLVGGVRLTGSITGGTNQLVLTSNALDSADPASLTDRIVTVNGAGTSIGGITFSTAAGSSLITASGAFFTGAMVSTGYFSPTGQWVTIRGAGPNGSDYYGRIIQVLSGTQAVVWPNVASSVSGATGFMNLVTTISSYNSSTNTLTLASNATTTISGGSVSISSPIPSSASTYQSRFNYEGVSASLMTGTNDQPRLPVLSSTATNASFIYESNTQLFQSSDYGGSGSNVTITDSLMGVSNPEEIDRIKLIFEFPALFMISERSGNEYNSWVELQVFFEYRYDVGEPYTSELVVGRAINYPADDVNVNPTSRNPYPINNSGYISALKKKPFLWEYLIDIENYQPFTDWRVVVKRVNSNDPAGDGVVPERYNVSNDCYFKTIEAQVVDKLNYPGSAYAAITFQAKDFPQPPTRAYHLRGKKIKVPTNYLTREELNSSQATYTRNITTGVDTGSEQDWDGNFRGDITEFPASTHANFNLVYCNNPAWVFYDIVTNPLYGLGSIVDSSLINKYALYQIARYCDELVPDGKGGLEPRFTCNVYITEKTEAYKVLKDLATVFRGILYWINGEVLPVQDTPKEPTYTFTQANVINGLFEYESVGERVRINQVNVTWNDPDDFYRQAVEIVEDTDNIIEKNRIIATDIVAFGCTSKGQAHRAGQWYLTTNALENEIVKFATSTAASYLMPGEIINIQDQEKDDIQFSGRISNSGTVTDSIITLDREVTLYAGSTYLLHCFFPSGGAYLEQDSATINGVAYVRGNYVAQGAGGVPIDSREDALNTQDDSGNYVSLYWNEYGRVESKTVTTSPGTTNLITVSGNFSEVPVRESIWALSSDGGAAQEGENHRSVTYRILSIEEDAQDNYSIVASKYDINKYSLVDFGYESSNDLETQDPSVFDNEIPAPVNVTLEYRSIAPVANQNPSDPDIERTSSEIEAIVSWDVPTRLEPTSTILAEAVLSSELGESNTTIPVSTISGFTSGGGYARIGGNYDYEWVNFGSTSASPTALGSVARARLGTRSRRFSSGTSVVEYATVSTRYRYLAGFEVSIFGGNLNSPIIFRVPASQTELSIRNLSEGRYTVRVRTVNTRGRFSAYTNATRTLGLPQAVGRARVNRLPVGGQLGAYISFNTSTGALSIPIAPFTYINSEGQNFGFGSPVNLDFSVIPAGQDAYMYHDVSAGGFILAQIQQDSGWYASDGAALISPPPTRSFSWWKLAGAANYGLLAATGTISTTLNSTRIEGVGTSFLTEYAVGDMIRLSTQSSLASLGTDAWYGEVDFIDNDTVLYTRSPVSKVFTNEYAFRQAFLPDFRQDSILVNVEHTASPDAYVANYYITFVGTPGNDGADGADGEQGWTLVTSNEAHVFFADSNGDVSSNDFTSIIRVFLGTQEYNYDGSSPYAIDTFRYANFTDTNCVSSVDASGNITITGGSSILTGLSALTARVEFDIIDNNTSTVIGTKVLSLTKAVEGAGGVAGVRGGSVFTIDADVESPDIISNVEAQEFAGGISPFSLQAAQDVAQEVMNLSSDGFIRPNDRVTVASNISPATAGTRIYIGAPTNTASTVTIGSWSDPVVEIIPGSAIVEGTLSASTLAANTTLTNNLVIGSRLTLNTTGFINTTGKTTYADNDAGVFLGYDAGAYKLNIGNATQFVKWDGTNVEIAGDLTVQSTGVDLATVESGATAGASYGEVTVRNANFENGDVQWTKQGNWGIQEWGVAHQGTWAARCNQTDGTSAALRNSVLFPCAEGDRFLAGGYARWGGGWAGTSIYWRICFLASDGITEVGPYGNGNDVTVLSEGSWHLSRIVAAAPATVHFARLEAIVIEQTAGNAYFDDGFMIPIPQDADINVNLGLNVLTETGAVVSGDQINSPDLGGTVFNSNMRIVDLARNAPAGWYGSQVFDGAEVVSYQDAARTILRLWHPSDSAIRVVSTAFPVSAIQPMRIRVRLRGNVLSGSGLYIRPLEYDSDLPEGKVALGWVVTESAQATLLQEATRERILTVENAAVPSAWQDYTIDWTPTSTARWASIMILNWTDHGLNELWIDRVTVESLTTANGSTINPSGQVAGNMTVISGGQITCGFIDLNGTGQRIVIRDS